MIRGAAMMVMGSNVGIMAAMLAQPTANAIFKNTIDQQAFLSEDRNQVVISGPIGCDAGTEVTIRVVLTQPSSGASAEGETEVICTGNDQQWSITAFARGDTLPAEGLASVCAAAVTREDGDVTGGRHWCARKGVVLSDEP